MKVKLAATVLTVFALAGCASTTSNHASSSVLLDDGSYYFSAQGGQGDYYFAAPVRDSANGFQFSYGAGPFWPYSSRYFYGHSCGHGPWHCSPWAYSYGQDNFWMFGRGYGWNAYPGYRDPRFSRRHRGVDSGTGGNQSRWPRQRHDRPQQEDIRVRERAANRQDREEGQSRGHD